MKSTCKVPGGKLLTVEYELQEDKIKFIRITGDFFAHPEWCIEELERMLIGKDINSVKDIIEETLKQKGFQIIGFAPADIENMIRKDFV